MAKSHTAVGGEESRSPRPGAAALAALGIVFGDIGTSPLYAFRECFHSPHGERIALHPANLTGAASLIIWALLLIVSLKYLFVILRLDNKGEGGILALAALIRSRSGHPGASGGSRAVLLLGLIGAALIYADGMLTPAISVLSAVEGLAVSAPSLQGGIVPIAVALLALLFAIQKNGTQKVGRWFGPVVLLWFLVLGGLGVRMVVAHPEVLLALSPWEGVAFVAREWRHALPLLAAVFLAVTGGEALYADLGHFGRRPIRVSWFAIVLPGLALNYLGQAALLSTDPDAIRSPFFLMAPEGWRFALTLLATAAAIIASQALISGAYSLTTQAIQLGVLPRLRILHTSEQEAGQVYVPAVNGLLAIACILLVIAFGSSAALAGAYGIAISLTMTITSLLFFHAAAKVWRWSRAKALWLTALFLLADGAFLIANFTKLFHGGWLPLLIAAVLTTLMLVWIGGRRRLRERIVREAIAPEALLADLDAGAIHRVRGTAIFMTGGRDLLPAALLHNLKHNQVLHEQVFLLQVITLDTPRATREELLSLEPLRHGLHRVTLRFGFAEKPDVPRTLRLHLPKRLRFSPTQATYFLGRESYLVPRHASLLQRWRLSLFETMSRNASPATAWFHLPPGRVVELGAQLTLP